MIENGPDCGQATLGLRLTLASPKPTPIQPKSIEKNNIVKRHGGANGHVMANVDGGVNGHVMTNDLSQD